LRASYCAEPLNCETAELLNRVFELRTKNPELQNRVLNKRTKQQTTSMIAITVGGVLHMPTLFFIETITTSCHLVTLSRTHQQQAASHGPRSIVHRPHGTSPEYAVV
jgi:hypothetical protein